MENPFLEVTDYLDRIDSKLNQLIAQDTQKDGVKENQFLTIQEAADLLCGSVPTLYSKRSKGEIKGVSKVGKRLLFDKQILLDWIKEKRQKTQGELQEEAHTFLKRKGGAK